MVKHNPRFTQAEAQALSEQGVPLRVKCPHHTNIQLRARQIRLQESLTKSDQLFSRDKHRGRKLQAEAKLAEWEEQLNHLIWISTMQPEKKRVSSPHEHTYLEGQQCAHPKTASLA